MTDIASTTTQTAPAHGVLLTDAAVDMVKSLLERAGREGLRLRVGVQQGGCCHSQYQLHFDDQEHDGDRVVDFGGVEVIVDGVSAPALDGVTIDYADTAAGQGFTVDAPDAAGGCACGDDAH